MEHLCLATLAGLLGPLRELVWTYRGCQGLLLHLACGWWGGEQETSGFLPMRGLTESLEVRLLRQLDELVSAVLATKRLGGPAPQVETGWRSRPRMPPPGTGQCRRPSHDPKRNRGFVKATECSEKDRMNSEYEGDSLDGGSSA